MRCSTRPSPAGRCETPSVLIRMAGSSWVSVLSAYSTVTARSPTRTGLLGSRCLMASRTYFLTLQEAGGAVSVSAHGKMSEIAEMELTHRGSASSTEKPWRCERDVAKGGRRERDLRDERGRPFRPGDCTRVGCRSEHGAAVSELSGGDAAQATASAFLKAGRLHRLHRPPVGGGSGQLRRAAPGAA